MRNANHLMQNMLTYLRIGEKIGFLLPFFYLMILACATLLAIADPRLSEEALDICPCDIPSQEVQSQMDALLAMDYALIAAPQIGLQEAILVVQGHIFINPSLLSESEEKEWECEECLSTGPICASVQRAKTIVVQYYDRRGEIHIEEFSGAYARLLQHGIDHLDGIRFPDRLEKEEPLYWIGSEKQQCPRAVWEKMIGR